MTDADKLKHLFTVCLGCANTDEPYLWLTANRIRNLHRLPQATDRIDQPFPAYNGSGLPARDANNNLMNLTLPWGNQWPVDCLIKWVTDLGPTHNIQQFQSEPGYQNQNFIERYVQEVKSIVIALTNTMNTPPEYYFSAACL